MADAGRVPIYTVKQVAALTGVAEATLRAWERRYGVVRPERSSGGYRLFDDAQVSALRDMAALVAQGVPASRAAQAVSAVAARNRRVGPLAGLPASQELVDAAASLEPACLTQVIERAIVSGPFEQVAEEWIQPQLGRMGDAWESGRLSIAQEHFASAGLMRAMSAVFDEAGRGVEGAAVLVGLPAGERHELALLAFATCLRRQGVDVVYLGADVPTDEWVKAAERLGARAAVMGVTSARAALQASLVLPLLTAVSPPLSVWVGGSHRRSVDGALMLPDLVSQAAALLRLSLASGRT